MDRISELPDELLLKILLLLPTQVAVSTSLLSKRWEFLWMWLPELEYNIYSESVGKSLGCFLNKNLLLHKAPVIKNLCLKFWAPHFKPEDVERWVLAAVSRIIHELDIRYRSYSPAPCVSMPSSLYACKSLVVLKLCGKIILDVPQFCWLPSLKTLKLRCVRYFSEDSFRRLLSICPVLKHLSVIRCNDDNMGDFRILKQSLESLSIQIHLYSHDGYVIDTPSLKHFKLIDYSYESHYCLIENMPELSEGYVNVESPDITSLIGSLAAVKNLSICSQAMYGDGFVFKQLEHLKFCLCEVRSWDLLVRLLKDSPNLREVQLSRFYCHDSYFRIDFWNQPTVVPECLLSSLQTFILSCGYHGEPEERDLVIYILENARHLKTVNISYLVVDDDGVTTLQMIQELARASRASTMCELVVDDELIPYAHL